MPYIVSNPPEAIKSLPKHAQEIWIRAFNAAFDQYKGNEEICHSVAWAAVKKAGYKQDSDGKWVKIESEMLRVAEFGELCSEQIDIKTDHIDIKKITEGDPEPFFVIAKALKVGISGNHRRYSAEILQKVKKQLPVYGYLGHIKEEETGYKYRDPVTIWLAGEILNNWLYIKGYIPPTEDRLRKQVKLSLNVGKPMPVSILGEYNIKKIGNIWDVLDVDPLISIDWAPSGLEGIKGAQVISIGKEQQNQHEEDSMERAELIASLTLADLKSERPDLITTLASEMANSAEAVKKQKELDEKIKTLESENLKLNKQMLETHRTQLLGEYKDEKIRNLAGELLKGETIAELDTNFPGVKTKIAEFAKGMPIITGAGDTKPGSDFINKNLL